MLPWAHSDLGRYFSASSCAFLFSSLLAFRDFDSNLTMVSRCLAFSSSVFNSVSGSPFSEGSALGSSSCGTSAYVNPSSGGFSARGSDS